MPLSYHFDSARRRLFTRASGPVTFAEIREHLQAERVDRYLGSDEVIDGREATVAFSQQEVRQVVDLLRELGAREALGPTAVVVSSDVAYGVMRMVEALISDVCAVKPFRDMAEAERWLAQAS